MPLLFLLPDTSPLPTPAPNEPTKIKLFAKIVDLCEFRPTFCRSQDLLKIIYFRNHTSPINSTLDTQGLDLYDLLKLFGHPFLINFRDHIHILNWNMYTAKSSFLHLNASHHGIIFFQQIKLLRNSVLGLIFIILFDSLGKNITCWTPFKIQLAPKWHPKSPSGAPKYRNNLMSPCSRVRPRN